MAWKRTKQYRLPGFDYASAGAYFITIVCKDRCHFLGEITDEELLLSPAGKQLDYLIEHLAEKINWCTVNEYQIMPNHVHLILSIHDHAHNQQWAFATGLQPLRRESVSSFVNHLKGKIKRWCSEQDIPEFAWQARFHDRVIRNEAEYQRITEYVGSNIENWTADREFIPPE